MFGNYSPNFYQSIYSPNNTHSMMCHTMGKVTVIVNREFLYLGPFGVAGLCGLVFFNKREAEKKNIKLGVFPMAHFISQYKQNNDFNPGEVIIEALPEMSTDK
ncbi:hypothetical protein ACKWTF_005081 [Chironomus riparius]